MKESRDDAFWDKFWKSETDEYIAAQILAVCSDKAYDDYHGWMPYAVAEYERRGLMTDEFKVKMARARLGV